MGDRRDAAVEADLGQARRVGAIDHRDRHPGPGQGAAERQTDHAAADHQNLDRDVVRLRHGLRIARPGALVQRPRLGYPRGGLGPIATRRAAGTKLGHGGPRRNGRGRGGDRARRALGRLGGGLEADRGGGDRELGHRQ